MLSKVIEPAGLAAGGASPRTIADTLIVSQETVASHIKSIRRKLGVRSRAEAVQVAQKLLTAAA